LDDNKYKHGLKGDTIYAEDDLEELNDHFMECQRQLAEYNGQPMSAMPYDLGNEKMLKGLHKDYSNILNSD